MQDSKWATSLIKACTKYMIAVVYGSHGVYCLGMNNQIPKITSIPPSDNFGVITAFLNMRLKIGDFFDPNLY